MKKTIITLLMTTAVWAQQAIPAAEFQWPTTSAKVVIKNRQVQTGWKDGIPHARYADVAPLLNLPPSDEVDVNLAEVLARKGYLITVKGGTIEAKPNPSGLAEQLTWVPAAEFTWPTTKVAVVVKGRDALATWVDGRPTSAYSVLGPLLNLPDNDRPTVDLAEALAEAGYVVARRSDGSVEAKPGERPAAAPAVVGGMPYQGAPARVSMAPSGGQTRRVPYKSTKYVNGRKVTTTKYRTITTGTATPVRNTASAPVPSSSVPAGVRVSDSYRRAEANWNKQLASGEVTLASDPAAQERLDRIGARVALASRRNAPWHFFLVKDKSPNAACLGEGFVFVTTGLLKLGLTDDELAGVLGHEIAHGTEMHLDFQDVDSGIRQAAIRELEEAQALAARYEREYQQDSSQNAEASYHSKMVTVQRRISSAQKKIDYLRGKKQFSAEFDQQQEIEADQVGMRYAVTAGFSAEGLMTALQKLEAHAVNKFGYGYTADSRTHPDTSRRLEVLRKVQSSWRR